jgi:hypothetical protein
VHATANTAVCSATSPRVIDPEVAIADLSVAARLVEERTGPCHMTPP